MWIVWVYTRPVGYIKRLKWYPIIEKRSSELYNSKYSGLPYLLLSEEWPKCKNIDNGCNKYLEFHLQLNIDELPQQFKEQTFKPRKMDQKQLKGKLIHINFFKQWRFASHVRKRFCRKKKTNFCVKLFYCDVCDHYDDDTCLCRIISYDKTNKNNKSKEYCKNIIKNHFEGSSNELRDSSGAIFKLNEINNVITLKNWKHKEKKAKTSEFSYFLSFDFFLDIGWKFVENRNTSLQWNEELDDYCLPFNIYDEADEELGIAVEDFIDKYIETDEPEENDELGYNTNWIHAKA